jgi:hypothetical protein
LSTSLEAERTDQERQSRKFALALRVLCTLSALAALTALWSVERARFEHDLQLAAEPRARPGEQLALAAFLFRDVDATEGASLSASATTVRLLDESGRELAKTELTETPLTSMEGQLTLPSAISGQLTLEAESALEGERLLCRRALDVDEEAAPALAHGRIAGPLQQRSLGRVRTLSEAPAPDRLLVHAVGGACVPERRCQLLVWVGEPGAAIHLRASPSVEVLAPAAAPESAGLVAFWVIVRGPEAELTLEARRADQLVAERPLRLPVGLGEVAIYARQSIVEPSQAQVELAPPPGRDYAIVDLFARARWRATHTLESAHEASSYRPREQELTPGLLRIQARVDRFSAESAGARVLYVRSPGENDATALTRIASEVAREYVGSSAPTAAWARQLPAFALADPQRAAAFLLATLEEQRLALPVPVSSRPAQVVRLEHTRLLFRYGVAGALALSAIVIGLSLGRRGLLAADQADAILRDARTDDPSAQVLRPGERLRGRLRVLVLVLAVTSAFLAGALLIAAKPLWF